MDYGYVVRYIAAVIDKSNCFLPSDNYVSLNAFPKRFQMPPNNSAYQTRAFCTLLTSASYLPGALVLRKSLQRQTPSIPFVILCSIEDQQLLTV
jgi:hypothetical protein